jgi:hypothetical protein
VHVVLGHVCMAAGVAKDWMLIGLSVWLYKSPVSAINLGTLHAACTLACAVASLCVQTLFGAAVVSDLDMYMRAGGYLVAFAAVLW